MPAISDAGLRARDPRLDFFRGLGMFIILIAHIPWNSWTDWIPARFGFSDAADLFVFCSGMASALAFGRVFAEQGWLMGAGRIAHRLWQVYWAHICSFLVVLAVMIAADLTWGGNHYVQQELNLGGFFEPGRAHVLALLTLTYVPNYFDILPMYLAILAMVPLVMALAQVHRALVLAFVLVLWALANHGMLGLLADPWDGRRWFFNPFGWQLLFFTGFALVRGWLPAPPRNRWLIGLALGLIALAVPVACQDGFACYAGFGSFPALGRIHDWLAPLIDKMNYGLLRYAHFLATAYIAYLLAGEGGRNLTGRVVDLTRRVGQQTLGVFLTGLVTAQLMGMVMDRLGRSFAVTLFANLLGCAILVAAALVVHWFKNPPWTGNARRAAVSRAPSPETRAVEGEREVTA